jgi:hypothetical protein
MWYEFNTLDEFNTWHDALCIELGYPLQSSNQATGKIDPNATMTTAYCEAILVEDKYIAFIEEEYANGLKVTDLRIPKPIFE